MIEALALPLLRRLDPERAHWLSIRALSSGIVPMPRLEAEPALATHIGGLKITAPLGLAAGYDKNAEAVGPLTRAGFGFVEVGAATPLPQEGNPRPRLFRLTEDRAVINRFGFNNEGVDAVVERLARARRSPHIPVGLNLGANKTSVDRARDYGIVLKRAAPVIDFATVNVSSPNTENLRDLQGPEALRA
ncbi:MAG: dihydroorotate dehydrogenase 2, partial [Pseudomonadota bacterium]